ncbi:MAG: prenyltransferase/squalene oxidase repeat-containing protein, partial [Acidobacteriota bacterium]
MPARPPWRRRLVRALLTASLGLTVAASTSTSTAAAPHPAHSHPVGSHPVGDDGVDGCVVDPAAVREALLDGVAPHPGLEKNGGLGVGEWRGDTFVLQWPFGASYDREVDGAPNAVARRWVTRSLLETNPDRYDFVLVFTNFDWNSGAAGALYWGVRNDTEGIGGALFDNSSQWGTETIQGYIDAKSVDDYRRSDGTLDERRTEVFLNHELGHRWLVRPQVDWGDGPSDALIGQDGAHWSYLLDTDASYLYGGDWVSNGDGTYTSVAERQRFSELGLYLMGLISPDQVEPFTLLENPAIDPTQVFTLGDTIEATPRTLTVDDVIAAEGARSPSWRDSQKVFSVAVVYLVDPTISVTQRDFDLIDEIRTFWRQSLFRETRGRAVVDPSFQGTLGGGDLEVDLDAAVQWLVGTADPLWRDSGLTVVRDTAAAVDALARAGGQRPSVEDALRQLPDAAADSTELRARRAESVVLRPVAAGGDGQALVDALIAERRAGGGWATEDRYAADPVTTARAVRALTAAGRAGDAASAWEWLEAHQNADGGWPWQTGGASSTVSTLEVLLAARHLDPDAFWTLAAVARGFTWVESRARGGGFGDLYPEVVATALVLQLTLDQPVPDELILDALAFLAAHQRDDGSWQGSPYKTGLAMSAAAPYLLPDFYVDAAEVVVEPENPYE